MERRYRSLDNRGDPVIIATSGRSGTHLLIDTIRHQFPEFALHKRPCEPVSALFVPLEEVAAGVYPVHLARRTFARANRAIVRSHDWPEVLDRLRPVDAEMDAYLRERGRVVCVVRDPLVAFPKLWALAAQQFGWAVGATGQEAFVAQKASQWAAQVRAIQRSPQGMFIKLEDMLEAPTREIARLAMFLDTQSTLRAPLLIPPRRTRFESLLTRLRTRPLSTHALLRERARMNFPMKWTEELLAILDRHAGEAIELVGYRRPAHLTVEHEQRNESCILSPV